MTLILSRNIHGHDTQMNLNKDTYGQLIGEGKTWKIRKSLSNQFPFSITTIPLGSMNVCSKIEISFIMSGKNLF